ncbi:hypothetical protein K458DRAFT_373755 [Lentithecium fluviatile CBS 122367]|uniref:HTH CENPB-type domain-containing protein n=1 Tax=Lentithecium fluviatile CBS 122367 TaxID=1168545 RepID=A0A6G1IPG6_9PLEO|nr:hypothetical protein K458DRAFT_373755 [Lentithecium fluviatile CBS 122367]
MDQASRVLAQALRTDEPKTFDALARLGNVPLSTLHHRARGRESKEAKAQRQQYLTPEEERAVVNFLLLNSSLGHPVRIKYIPCLAFTIASQRSTNKPTKPPGKNWAKAFERRHPELKARRDPAILPKNVYNMDKTGVMLSMLGSVKVLVGKNDLRDYRGAGVKRTMVTAIS